MNRPWVDKTRWLLFQLGITGSGKSKPLAEVYAAVSAMAGVAIGSCDLPSGVTGHAKAALVEPFEALGAAHGISWFARSLSNASSTGMMTRLWAMLSRGWCLFCVMQCRLSILAP